MAAKTKRLPVRDLDAAVEWFPFHRQSLLGEFDQCPLRTKWRLEVAEAYPLAARMDRSWDSTVAARGVLAHRYAAEVLRTLYMTGNDRMEVAQALEVLYEVCQQHGVPDTDIVYIPARERRYLRMFAIRFVSERVDGNTKLRTWDLSKLIAIERRQYATITYTTEDGTEVKRTVTGQPDVTLRGGPGEIICLDWKTTPKAPAQASEDKRDPDGTMPGDDTPSNISYEGYFQQRVYGLLELVNDAECDRVTLREVYPMDPDGLQVRKATVYRADLERITRELGTLVGLLDRAIMGGSGSAMWKPQPGKHCSHCPRPGSCPIPREERGDGAITGPGVAAQYGAQFVVADAVRSHRRLALKAWHEQTGHPIPVRSAKGRAEFRYRAGTKNFGMYVPDDSDRGPEDPRLKAAVVEAAERKPATA